MTAPRPILAWHWLSTDRRLGYGDGRLVEPGQTLTIDGEPKLCGRGLHGARSILHALKHARGPIVCRVRLSGRIVEANTRIVKDDTRLAGTERRCLWMLDATTILREWAIWCAERALDRMAARDDLDKWDRRAISAGSDALDCARRYLAGEVSEATLVDARVAAWAAAWSATTAAAKAAATAAATAVDTAAATDVITVDAWSATTAAASAAIWAAATDAEQLAQARKLERMIRAEHKRQMAMGHGGGRLA
jgi:hypothetical protein